MKNRLEALQESYFPGKADALLVENGINRKFLLHFSSSAGTLIILPQKSYFIIDFRYIEAARMQIHLPDCEIILQDRLYDQLNEIFTRHGVKTVGVEDDRLTLSQFALLEEKLPSVRFLPRSGLSAQLLSARMIKTPEEIGKIRQAQGITDAAFTHILNYIRPGVTEKQVALELEYQMKKMGADDLSFETIAVAGKNSSRPHGVPSGYPIQRGDFVTMDFGALVDGYHSDMTRTVAVGSVSEEQERVYEPVLTAQLMALEAIAEGKACSEIDKIARDYINENGYEGCFGHGLGHGVGLEIHEEPRFSPGCQEILKNNMVITVEPGIYLEGKFGVRIEDFVVVAGDTAVNLTKSEKKLICL